MDEIQGAGTPPAVLPEGVFDGKAYAATLPLLPGVYRMLDARGKLLYVGKAKALRKRVSSYFSRPQLDPRLHAMVSQVARMDFTVAGSEAEALVLESRMIKAQRPRYNILLRDGKGYPYLRLTMTDTFPKLAVYRGKPMPGMRDFGPFPSGEAVRHGLNVLQKTFQLRNCDDTMFAHRSRPCLQHHIGRCSAPCVKLVTPEAYGEQVQGAIAVLEGRGDSLIAQAGEAMTTASTERDYEQAARWRDRIAQLRQTQARMQVQSSSTDRDVVACAMEGGVVCVSVLTWRDGQHLGARSFFPSLPFDATVSDILMQVIGQVYVDAGVPGEIVLAQPVDEPELLEAALSTQAGRAVVVKHEVRAERAQQVRLAQSNADETLRSRLRRQDMMVRRWDDLVRMLGLSSRPTRIEAYDISHTQGEAPVAAGVVFGPDGPIKAQYRRYHVEGITGGDDVAAMAQALRRRLSRAVREQGPLPDVLLIDGGLTQVKAVDEVVQELGLTGRMTLVGVAKGVERRAGAETLVRLGLPDLVPGPASPGLHLIQMVRDEAHRFAGAGHRARREKARTGQSPLEGIEGIGPTRRKALLVAFGGMQGIQAATIDELALVPGFSRALAVRVYEALKAP